MPQSEVEKMAAFYNFVFAAQREKNNSFNQKLQNLLHACLKHIAVANRRVALRPY